MIMMSLFYHKHLEFINLNLLKITIHLKFQMLLISDLLPKQILQLLIIFN